MRRKLISFAMIATMVLTVFAPMPALAKSKTKDPALVKKVTEKAWNSNRKKWYTYSVKTYTYNKRGYPSKIKIIDRDPDQPGSYVVKMKYKFNGNKPKSMKDTSGNTYEYNKNGLPSKKSMIEGDYKEIVTYKYKKNIMKQSIRWVYQKDEEGKWERDTDVKKCRIKQRRGLPVEIRTGSMIEKFDSKGLLIKRKGGGAIDNTKETIKYRIKKGRVVSMTTTTQNAEGVWKYKYTFTYTKKKISKKRYVRMINSFAASGWGSEWFWY